MTIPARIMDFVEKKHVDCSIVRHPYSETSLESAHSAHISSECLAKGVLLTDAEELVLAVLPASHEIELPSMKQHFGMQATLAPEEKLAATFEDCVPGAVPALGKAYGIRTVVDDALAELADVYFEAGDHTELIHVSGEDFRKLMEGAEYARISQHRKSAQA